MTLKLCASRANAFSPFRPTSSTRTTHPTVPRKAPRRENPESEDPMNVAELMLSPVHTCLKQDNLARAAQIMWEHDSGALPVLDDLGLGEPVAMITDRDICMAAYTQGKPLSEIQVTTAASHHLTSVPSDDSVQFALSLMAKHQVHRLPVADREET